jgi:hypothetical protein
MASGKRGDLTNQMHAPASTKPSESNRTKAIKEEEDAAPPLKEEMPWTSMRSSPTKSAPDKLITTRNVQNL